MNKKNGNKWGNPIRMFGYDDSFPFMGGDSFEAGTNSRFCFDFVALLNQNRPRYQIRAPIISIADSNFSTTQVPVVLPNTMLALPQARVSAIWHSVVLKMVGRRGVLI